MKTEIDRQRRALAEEKKFWSRGFDYVVGIDEAGRGPLAGPVLAGAVAIIPGRGLFVALEPLLSRINDSKKLSPDARAQLFAMLIKHKQIVWGRGSASVNEIDRLNVFEATKLAMKRALDKVVLALRRQPAVKIACVLDGNFMIYCDLPQTAIVGGDQKVFSIAAASIVAKVSRDRIMERLDKKYPVWDFAANKGYPTPKHLRLLAYQAPSAVHRRSFGPVREALECNAKTINRAEIIVK